MDEGEIPAMDLDDTVPCKTCKHPRGSHLYEGLDPKEPCEATLCDCFEYVAMTAQEWEQ